MLNVCPGPTSKNTSFDSLAISEIASENRTVSRRCLAQYPGFCASSSESHASYGRLASLLIGNPAMQMKPDSAYTYQLILLNASGSGSMRTLIVYLLPPMVSTMIFLLANKATDQVSSMRQALPNLPIMQISPLLPFRPKISTKNSAN